MLYINASVLKVIKEKKRGLCYDLHIFGEQGWCSGQSIRLLGTNVAWVQLLASTPYWVKFVVGSFPCSKRFFYGHSGFPLSSKTNISKFQFNQESGRRRTTMWLCYLQIVIYFLYLFKKFWRLSMGMPIGE